MSDEALKRRVQRLFRTLVLGGAALASHAGCDDKTDETPVQDAGHGDADDDDSGSGPQFW